MVLFDGKSACQNGMHMGGRVWEQGSMDGAVRGGRRRDIGE